ncbi:MAG: hypothetical protein K8W52_19610 [Deltaproteobacteria bacterium]|nr:hypothetical protein [Deltaproteobacteria bacterium]
MRTLLLIVTLGAASCGESPPRGPVTPATTDAAAGACSIGGTSTLPGVSIAFPGAACAFTLAEAARGIAIPYAVVVHDDLANVVAAASDAGGCKHPDASGLILGEEIAGGDQHYCLCDTGLCPAPDPTPHAIAAGSYPGAFAWDGVNWNGPSDTGNPKGAPFPPGDYTVTIGAHGTHDGAAFAVTGTLVIHLVP